MTSDKGLGRFIFDKAMDAHARSPRRFAEGPPTVSVWGWLWWNFVVAKPRW